MRHVTPGVHRLDPPPRTGRRALVAPLVGLVLAVASLVSMSLARPAAEERPDTETVAGAERPPARPGQPDSTTLPGPPETHSPLATSPPVTPTRSVGPTASPTRPPAQGAPAAPPPPPPTTKAPPNVPAAPTTTAPAAPPAPAPVELNYPDFSGASGLALNGAASLTGGVLRLTPGSGVTAGSAWARTPIVTNRSFATSFQVWLRDGGGEGLAFVVQREGTGALGEARGALGYGDVGGTANRISPSVAVELDVWDNSWDPDTGDSHVAITTHGQSESWRTYGMPSFDLWSDVPMTVWVTYDAGAHRLSAYVSRGSTRPSSPLVSVGLDLAATLGGTTAYAGFTASTGEFIEAQDVLTWRLAQ